MGENSNQLAGLLSQLESFLTEKHGAQGNNLMEKIGSLKGVISDELHGKLSGVLSKLGGSDKLSSTSGLGGAGAIGSLLAGFLGG
ncbi:MAG: hypothetical protein Q4G69_13850, partial [Planctomycetia bacterium]|nr:hypothetical protein [Planctomycetia bacterium]